MDHSFTALTPEQLAHFSRHHSPPYAPTVTVRREAEPAGPDKGGSRLEHSAGRVEHVQGSGLGLAWRPTGPDVRPTSSSTTAPAYVGGGGVSHAGSSAASVDFGPFSVVLVLEDGSIVNQPTWPTINVQLLREQVSMTLQCCTASFFFVCHGFVLDLQRKLSDRPVIDSTTPIYVFTSLGNATQALARTAGQEPHPPSPGRDGGWPHSRAPFGQPSLGMRDPSIDPRLECSYTFSQVTYGTKPLK
jgi:hypothetical protein